ncbi:MAG: hypothetical protein AVDCRST_MAG73-2318 [uncultured Thermomicrobiales bacterium]|uniref:Cytoplasmic protein clustered with trehalase n=1 Tax=uncultured Thermomicrobiales bacterium TaxID=1645740 RepID=A0A6J4UAU0_9BACT|nr:MAG: hypothetical protein AVDCRST_MAG73-2318 [uncultured Thermomicrobiales bacterium]
MPPTTADPNAVALTADEARLLSVAAQRLDRRPPGPPTKDGLLATIRALGCVQLDTISVISRTQQTVLWSRHGPYDVAWLDELHHPDGALIEYWAHACALVPAEDFPFYREAMAFYRAKYDGYARDNADLLDRVRAAIRERGPLYSRDFERPPGPRPDPWTWYGGKPEREALDALWTWGEVAVLRRDAFQRIYDLTERVIAPEILERAPTEDERRRHFVGTALSALGVATPKWAADYFRSSGRPHVRFKEVAAELSRMAADGLAIPATVNGWTDPVWLSPAAHARLDRLRAGEDAPTLTTLLAPFDSLIWHRARTSALFGFDYLLESYTPAAKRRYGYYTLPILRRGRLVGRLDPSLDRKRGVLTVRALHLEPDIVPNPELAADIAWALKDLLAFLGGESVVVTASDPVEFGPMVAEALGGGESP